MPRKQLRITSIRHDPPDTRLIARALIELVRQQGEAQPSQPKTKKKARHG